MNGAGVNILNIQIPARMLRMFTPAPLELLHGLQLMSNFRRLFWHWPC
jgi:hypothetical protein